MYKNVEAVTELLKHLESSSLQSARILARHLNLEKAKVNSMLYSLEHIIVEMTLVSTTPCWSLKTGGLDKWNQFVSDLYTPKTARELSLKYGWDKARINKILYNPNFGFVMHQTNKGAPTWSIQV